MSHFCHIKLTFYSINIVYMLYTKRTKKIRIVLSDQIIKLHILKRHSQP